MSTNAPDPLAFLEREGYRRCDIPACNCGSWHRQGATKRERELASVLGDAVYFVEAIAKGETWPDGAYREAGDLATAINEALAAPEVG